MSQRLLFRALNRALRRTLRRRWPNLDKVRDEVLEVGSGEGRAVGPPTADGPIRACPSASFSGHLIAHFVAHFVEDGPISTKCATKCWKSGRAKAGRSLRRPPMAR